MRDGNVAFKVTWVYGAQGPFTTPCTAEGRENNIRLEKKVWCSETSCPCNTVWLNGNQGPPVDQVPCYDAFIFKEWRFGAGGYHHGRKKGEPIPMLFVKPGKLAFFTTRSIHMSEEDRIVIGCYEIAGIIEGERGEGFLAVSKPESQVRVDNLPKAPRFWEFHKQSGGPRWNTGLFRYLPNAEAERLRDAVLRAAGR